MTTVVASRQAGKSASLAAAVAYMQRVHGGAQPVSWQLRILSSVSGKDNQEGFVLVMDDGEILPVPASPPGPEIADGSGYTRGGIPAGTVTSQRLASLPVVSASLYYPRLGAASINAAWAGFGLPPLTVPPVLAAPQQPAGPKGPGRRVLPPGSRRSSTGWYGGGMAGFAGSGVIPEEDPLDPGTEIPDVYGVVRGYRWWTLDAPDLRGSPARADEAWPRKLLNGMMAPWEPGENVAACRAGSKVHEDAEIPSESCSCGFWAYWELQRHDVGGRALPVCGVIEGYGAVLIGEKGFRAAKARIVALHLPFTIQPQTEADDDPLGLGLPPQHRSPPSTQSGYSSRTPSGQRNPWWNHPKFHGRVHGYPGSGGVDDDLAGLARPQPVPELSEPSADERQAARDAAEAWMAVIGDRLEQMYPGAKVFETRALMEKSFPPDRSYVPPPDPVSCQCSKISDLAYVNSTGHRQGCPLHYWP